MALRIQKSWATLGAPQKAGKHAAPRALGLIHVCEADIRRARELDGKAQVVLEATEAEGFLPEWIIVEMRAAT